MADKDKSLVLAIIDFLNKSIQDGTVKQDDRESLEVAIQCIGEAFGVDSMDKNQRERLSIQPANLQTIFDVFMKTRARIGTGLQDGTASASTSTPPAPTASDKAMAEKFKKVGNDHMTQKQYDKAIEAYTQAIASDSTNAVYYSNRAAAYSSKSDHLSAIGDAEKAIVVDPSFVKAYSRLGHAQYAIGDYKAAASAYRRGLEKDPTNANLKSGLQNAEARIMDDNDEPPPLVPDTAPNTAAGSGGESGSMADMLGNFGGGAANGGMPDLSKFMNTPMMAELMQNPSIVNMMNRVQSGSPLPTMAEIMADPALRDLANQFRAGSV